MNKQRAKKALKHLQADLAECEKAAKTAAGNGNDWKTLAIRHRIISRMIVKIEQIIEEQQNDTN